MDKIKTSLLIGLIGSITLLGGIFLTDDDVYYCEDKQIVMQCDKLTQYYSLENGKCWNNEIGNKLCKSGWIEVEDDFQADVVSQTTNAKQYLCSQEGCIPKVI